MQFRSLTGRIIVRGHGFKLDGDDALLGVIPYSGGLTGFLRDGSSFAAGAIRNVILVPEPGTLVPIALAILALAAIRRRNQHR